MSSRKLEDMLVPQGGSSMSVAHRCRPPVIASQTAPIQPPWTCAICGRVWADCPSYNGLRWWAEVRGPANEEDTTWANG